MLLELEFKLVDLRAAFVAADPDTVSVAVDTDRFCIADEADIVCSKEFTRSRADIELLVV